MADEHYCLASNMFMVRFDDTYFHKSLIVNFIREENTCKIQSKKRGATPHNSYYYLLHVQGCTRNDFIPFSPFQKRFNLQVFFIQIIIFSE